MAAQATPTGPAFLSVPSYGATATCNSRQTTAAAAAAVGCPAVKSRGRALQFEQFSGLGCNKLQMLCPGNSSSSRAAKLPLSTQRSTAVVVAMAASEGGAAAMPSLNELPLLSYINQQGFVIPPVEPGTQATVFAVHDANKKVVYIGFSKDVRNSLRTLLGRRPELCYFYKLHNLSTLDQQQMLSIRSQWFSELGLPPVGNTDPIQRSRWEKPVDAGSISERGKAAAAKSQAKTLLQTLFDRGLKEEMVYDPALLEQGLCDVLPSKALSAEEVAAADAAAAKSSSLRKRAAVSAPGGEVVEFDITYDNKIKTNGGWMFDVHITKDEKETRHRVVMGRIYPDAVGMVEEDFLERMFGFLLWKKLPRQTEGVLAGGDFAANYFAVSEVAQSFDDFKQWFAEDALPESYWRFNRIHTYGSDRAPVTLRPEEPALLTGGLGQGY